MNELFNKKYENYLKAINRQEGAYVPNLMSSSGGGIFWTGKTVFDVEDDPQAYAEAMTAVLDEIWIDVNLLCYPSSTPRMNRYIPTAENRFAPDGTLTHLQVPQMKADEYDQLIADPKAFIANVMLPRKHAFLYENRDVAKEALKVYAEESYNLYVKQDAIINKMLVDKYGVYTFSNMSYFLNTPIDHLFDFFRGFKGTLTDLRRQPDKVKAALDAIWEYRSAEQVKQPYDASTGFPFQPCHIPAYLSPKQFKELYWPYEKQLIEWIASNGGKIYLMMEGHWDKIMDCFLEVPKDSMVLAVDDDDFLEVHKRLGDHQILCGGLKTADVRTKSFDQIKDDIKRVIDTCGPGGGYLFNGNKSWLAPGDVNQTLIDCYNFAHEYSSK